METWGKNWDYTGVLLGLYRDNGKRTWKLPKLPCLEAKLLGKHNPKPCTHATSSCPQQLSPEVQYSPEKGATSCIHLN